MHSLWRLGETTPAQPADSAGWEKVLAHISHYGLYVLMIALVISGYLLWSAFPAWFDAARAPQTVISLFGWPVPGYYSVGNRDIFKYWEGIHEIASRIMMVLVAVHIVAALRHHIFKRNDVLTRMTRGKVGRA